MSEKAKGYVCGIIAAVCYGTNPLGALSLYADGITADSVLFYRYALAVVMIGFLMAVERKSFAISLREAALLFVLGILFATSSLTLYYSFNHMDAGIASTILFVYPVMVAVIMAVFFKERVSLTTVLSITLALVGIALLYRGDGTTTLSTVGVLLVLLSSLSYAVYIVIVNKSDLRMSSLKLTFYVMLFGTLMVVFMAYVPNHSSIQWLTTWQQWGYAVLLALLPTVISLILMVKSVHIIGSTPTAVMGALEPVTAVAIGVFVFGEAFSFRLGVGIILILTAVMIIVLGQSLFSRSITMAKSLLGHLRPKTWRWRS